MAGIGGCPNVGGIMIGNVPLPGSPTVHASSWTTARGSRIELGELSRYYRRAIRSLRAALPKTPVTKRTQVAAPAGLELTTVITRDLIRKRFS